MSNNSLAELNAETDSRFWAQTGYKPGHKLDPSDPTDKAMIKTWLDIFAKVKKEDGAGLLQLTHTSPIVQDNLAKASQAHGQVIDHLTAAATTPDPAIKDEHVKAAANAQNTVKNATRAAAAAQPPTVSPQVVASSAVDALKAVGGGPSLTAQAMQTVLAQNPTHPANAPAAQPASPELVKTAPPAPPRPAATIRDHVAQHQAQSAPGHSITVHEHWQPPRGVRYVPPYGGGFVPPLFPRPIVTPIPTTQAPSPAAASDQAPAQTSAPAASDDASWAPPAEKRSWFAEHAEMLALGGTLLVGLGLAVAAGGNKPRGRRRAPSQTGIRTVRVVRE